MKKILILTTLAVTMLESCSVNKIIAYEEYVRTSEELLWKLEELCELQGIYWEDTVCESDVWEDYCDAREELNLGYLVHYSNK